MVPGWKLFINGRQSGQFVDLGIVVGLKPRGISFVRSKMVMMRASLRMDREDQNMKQNREVYLLPGQVVPQLLWFPSLTVEQFG